MMEAQKTSFLQRPSFHYCLLMLLGTFGIYISMPIDLNPRSTVAWVDLIINLVIFVPCSLIAVFSGLFAIVCTVSSYDLDRKNRFKKSANIVVRGFGLSASFVSDQVDRTRGTIANGLTALGIPKSLLSDGPFRLLQKAVTYLYSNLFQMEDKAPKPIAKPEEPTTPADEVAVRDGASPGSDKIKRENR